MEELIEGICYGSSDKVVKNAFEKKDKKKEGEEYPYPSVPYGYVPAPGYVPVEGVPPGYVPAPGYVPVATAEGYMLAPGYYPPPPGYILEHQGDGDPAKHHSEKAKEEAIVELRKKKSGSQRLTEKILSWMPGMKI